MEPSRYLLVAVAVGLTVVVAVAAVGVPTTPEPTRPATPTSAAPESTQASPGGTTTPSPAGETATPPPPSPTPTAGGDMNTSVKVAFVADTGMSDSAREVFQLIKQEDTDLVVHSGDFDYQNDPQGFDRMLNEELGPRFPYLATVGNHDKDQWWQYQRLFENRTDRTPGLSCTGDYGLEATCTYRGVTVIQSSKGICNIPEDYEPNPKLCKEKYTSYDHMEYAQQQLNESGAMWRICSFHKVNEKYQVGTKNTAVPLGMYEACRKGGGIIATGHNHAYGRTYPLSDFWNQTVADRSPPYTIGNGQTFAFVSAADGYSFYDRGEMADAPWWAKTHTSGSFGVFFCEFRPDGTGTCYYKTVDGEVIDGPFEIRSAYANASSGSATAD